MPLKVNLAHHALRIQRATFGDGVPQALVGGGGERGAEPQGSARAAGSLALDQRDSCRTTLVTAWRETTNQEIAASIMGWIRQTALGDPLMPYEQRVGKALQRIANQTKAIPRGSRSPQPLQAGLSWFSATQGR